MKVPFGGNVGTLIFAIFPSGYPDKFYKFIKG